MQVMFKMSEDGINENNFIPIFDDYKQVIQTENLKKVEILYLLTTLFNDLILSKGFEEDISALAVGFMDHVIFSQIDIDCLLWSLVTSCEKILFLCFECIDNSDVIINYSFQWMK